MFASLQSCIPIRISNPERGTDVRHMSCTFHPAGISLIVGIILAAIVVIVFIIAVGIVFEGRTGDLRSIIESTLLGPLGLAEFLLRLVFVLVCCLTVLPGVILFALENLEPAEVLRPFLWRRIGVGNHQ